MSPAPAGPTARGRLVLVGTPVGNLGDLAPRAAQTLAAADVVACEDTRRTRRLLSLTSITARRLVSLHRDNEAGRATELLELLLQGATVALVSDAGMPAVSDPGQHLVDRAVDAGVTVLVVPGPSAVTMALAASGFAAPRWCFEGFLPRKGAPRGERLDGIAAASCPSVIYEAPQRVASTLSELALACGGSRRVAVARELTKLHEEIWRGSLDAACRRAGAVTPRGEHVLVVEGAPAPVPASSEAIVAALAQRLRDGLSRRDAVAAVAAELGIGRRAVYDLALSHAELPAGGARVGLAGSPSPEGQGR